MMSKKTTPTTPTAPADKLAAFDGLLNEGVDVEKIAEMAGVSVEEVNARALALLEDSEADNIGNSTSNVIPDSIEEMSADRAAARHATDSAELARRWAALERREAIAASRERGSTRSPAARAPGAIEVRVLRTFDATTRGPDGKIQSHRFVPTIFRGPMALRVQDIAEESGNLDCIEVVSKG
jgi:hypothetical protein